MKKLFSFTFWLCTLTRFACNFRFFYVFFVFCNSSSIFVSIYFHQLPACHSHSCIPWNVIFCLLIYLILYLPFSVTYACDCKGELRTRQRPHFYCHNAYSYPDEQMADPSREGDEQVNLLGEEGLRAGGQSLKLGCVSNFLS